MSNRNEVAIIYKQVIEDVLRKVRRDFVNMGVDEQVLQELQSGWEEKLMASGIFDVKPPPLPTLSQPLTAASIVGVDLSGAVPLTPIPPLLVGQPSYPPLGYVAPGSALSAFIPSQLPFAPAPTVVATTPTAAPTNPAINTPQRPERRIDSDPDALGSDLDSTDSELDGPTQGVVAAAANDGGEGAHEEQQQPDPKENFLLCLYEKVHRTRNKWRCTLQNGVLHIDGQEFVLGKINGEFEW
jgi:transcription initiation factor TFIIA large subunit